MKVSVSENEKSVIPEDQREAWQWIRLWKEENDHQEKEESFEEQEWKVSMI
jgi:hypothetical protein